MNAMKATLATLSLALALPACRAVKSASDDARGVPVRTVRAVARDLEDELVLTGTLRPRAQVQVVAEVSARLKRVLRD